MRCGSPGTRAPRIRGKRGGQVVRHTIVGRDDEARRRIDAAGLLVPGKISAPGMPRVAAVQDGRRPRIPPPPGKSPRAEIAEIALRVRRHHVLRRRANSRSAASNSSRVRARFIPTIPSSPRQGSIPTQRYDVGASPRALPAAGTGPPRAGRIACRGESPHAGPGRGMSLPPLPRTPTRRDAGSGSPRRPASPGSNLHRPAMAAVNPQATCGVRPISTAGTPASVTPIACKPGAVRATGYQRAGSPRSRCGSLHRMGFPVAVRSPPSTQLLLPTPGPRSPGTAWREGPGRRRRGAGPSPGCRAGPRAAGVEATSERGRPPGGPGEAWPERPG